MKRIWYLLVVAGGLFLSSCHDMEVGYLVTKTAEYPEDTLKLYNIKNRLQELLGIETRLHEMTASLQEEREGWEEEYAKRRKAIRDFDEDVIWPMEDELYNPNLTPEREEELERLLEEAYEKRDELLASRREVEKKLDALDKAIKEAVVELGFPTERALTDQIKRHRNTIDLKIPWVTSPIDGVLGTEPLMYSITEVKNESAENAALFRKGLTIMGGGRMYVDQNVEAPAGAYRVSIKIENEGKSAILEEAFTFIVE